MIPLQPYVQGFRICGLALCVLLLLAAGFKCGKDRGEVKLERAHTDLVICAADKNTLADALNQVNARAEQAKRDAAAQAQYAVQAVRQADKDRATYEAKLGSVESALERAKRQPICRAQLEADLCVSLD